MSSSPWSHPPTKSCDLPSSTGGPSFFLSQPCVPNSFPPLQAGEAGLEGLSSPLGEEGTRSAKSVRGFFRERSGSAGDFAGGRWAVLVVFFFSAEPPAMVVVFYFPPKTARNGVPANKGRSMRAPWTRIDFAAKSRQEVTSY